MRERLRIFWECSFLSFKALYVWLSPEFYIGTKFITPFFQVAFFALVAKFTRGPEAMTYAAIGNTVQIIAVNGIMGVAIVIGLERVLGTLTPVLLTPANRLLIFTSQTLFHVLDGVFGSLVCLFYGWLFFGIQFSNISWISFLALLILVAVSVTCIGVAVGAIGMISNNMVPIMNLVYLLLLLVCGVSVPLSEYPKWLQVIAECIPLTYGIEAIRENVKGIAVSNLLVQDVIPMLLLGAAYYSCGMIMLKLFERKNRIQGTLDRL